MTEEELLAFISRIIASGAPDNIRLTLLELRRILERDEADEKYIKLLDDLGDAYYEMSKLGKRKSGDAVSMDELATALREYRDRKERESRRC
jgi:hypothetical protein